MSTKTCGHKVPCGCGDTPLTTPPPCNESPECVGERCSELFEAGCIVYKGPDLACGEDVIVPDCTRVDQALANIVERLCETSEPTLESYVSNVTYNEETSELEITGEGNAFNGNVTIPSGNVYSNSIFVDAKYGDDTTGEYGNFAKPFKTIVAAEVAAVNFMNSNPYSSYVNTYLKYYDEGSVPSTVGVTDFPRVRIHIAPGVYSAEDEFQYLIDNPTLFDAELVHVLNPASAKTTRTWNMALNFVDYELDAGVVLINYGLSPYYTVSNLLGYEDYEYNVTGMSTNIFGNGSIISYFSLAGFEIVGSPISTYLEFDVSFHIECNTLIMFGYSYGGLIEIKCNNYIQLPSTGGDGGGYTWYLEENRATQKESYIECNNWIQTYYTAEIASIFPSSAFQLGGANFRFKANNFLGINLQERLDLASSIKQFNSANGILGWINNFFVNTATDPAICVSSYIDNYSSFRTNVIVDVDYIKTCKHILVGIDNDSFRYNIVLFKNKITEVVISEDTNLDNYKPRLFSFSGSSSNYNTQVHLLMNYVEVYGLPSNTAPINQQPSPQFTVDFFQFIDCGTSGKVECIVKDVRVKIRDSASIDAESLVSFISARPSYAGTINPRISVSNVIFESVNQEATDYFISVNADSLNVKLYNDSYSNVDNNIASTITNLIPGSNLIIDNNVIAI